jgi:hypothetical protein
MDETLRAQIDSNLSHLDSLIRRGRQIREILAIDPASKSALVANRAWQQDCGVAINQLSGGSKAHWLARAFSEAFLLRCHAWTTESTHRLRLWPRRFPTGSISFTTSSSGQFSSRRMPTAGTRWNKAVMERR